MKSFLALTTASIAAVSTVGCSNIQEFNAYCGISTNGYRMCFKNENVSCTSNKDGDVRCKANGVSTDLTGERSHYTSEETLCYKGSGWSGESHKYVNEDNWSCSAADNFKMIDTKKS